MRFVNNMKIGTRLNLFLSATIIVLLSAFGIYTYTTQMSMYLQEADSVMGEEVNDLALFVKQNVDKSESGADVLSGNNLEFIRELFSSKKYYNDGYPYLVKKSGEVIIHPTKEGGSFLDYDFFKDMTGSENTKGRSEYMWEGENKIQYFQYVEEVDSYVSVTIYEKYLKSKVQKTVQSLIVIICFFVLIFIAINWWLSTSITGGLKKAISFSESISKGDLTQELELDRKDEVGQLARSLQDMKHQLENIIAEVTEGANQITNASQVLSSGSTEQAASAEEVSAAMEEMIANIQQNTENANQTEKIADSAADEISVGYDNVNATVKSMQDIAEKITIVEEIAEKTDLLAINAAIEAARAGEHGKGFAVVAMEVRKLAERSQLAAAEINQLSKESVKIAEETGNKMGKIVPEIQRTSTLIKEISSASSEQDAGAEQVNDSLQLLNQTNQSTAASAEELAAQAESLKEAIAFFKVRNMSGSVSEKPEVNGYSSNGNMEVYEDQNTLKEIVEEFHGTVFEKEL